MTVTMNKQVVEAKWTTKQIQENVARVYALQFVTAMQLLHKFGGEQALTEFESQMRSARVEHIKSLGVKTPIELAKAMAEFDTNVFGSKVEIWGDEKQASMKFVSCAMWEALKKVGKFDAKKEEEMGHKFENCMKNTAKEFGFNIEMKMEGETCVVSFIK